MSTQFRFSQPGKQSFQLRRFFATLTISLVLLSLTACSNSDEKPAEDNKESSAVEVSDLSCGQILETSCIKCHSETRICDNLGKKSKYKWKHNNQR